METNPSKSVKDTYEGATKPIDKFINKAQTSLEHSVNRLRDVQPSLASQYEALKDTVTEGYDTTINTVKKYPLYAVLGSTAIGLMAGLLIARRKH